MEETTPTATAAPAAALRPLAAAVSPSSTPLERSVSQQSATSMRSARSATVRPRKKLTSHPSSSASSIAASDKSLTSFPSFSPESPRDGRSYFESVIPVDDARSPTPSSRKPSDSVIVDLRRPSDPQQQEATRPASIVESLTASPPSAASTSRGALFDDAPPSNQIPGALHHADDEHIERLIARHGAVNLVRQIAGDLAQRDAQMAAFRRRADERERALRKIVLECGLSNLDLETKLRAVEQEARENSATRRRTGDGVSDLMTDAMADDVRLPAGGGYLNDTTTIRASNVSLSGTDSEPAKGTIRGWKEYLWGGGGTSKKGSRASSLSMNSDPSKTVIRAPPAVERRPTLADDLFSPPETESARSLSRASSVHSATAQELTTRKPSLASLALRLVAGGATTGRESEIRGRATSAQMGAALRTPSVASNTSNSNRAVSAQGGPKALMAMRRTNGTGTVRGTDTSRSQPGERRDTTGSDQSRNPVTRGQSYGPVEMDRILPPEVQPPTLTHIYNNYNGAEYLTDRFGFIYDQRRKKRQREAARMARHVKSGSRTEMLTNGGRDNMSPGVTEDSASSKWDIVNDTRPGSPSSNEAPEGEAKPKRWQDYLKIATFPTELLSHTPSMAVMGFEVMEGGEVPKSPGLMTSEERGFLPPATTPTTAIAPIDNEPQPSPEAEQSTAMLAKEDAEPVKLLLQNLNNLHDTLQREKTIRWNDFLRKVRAAQKRDGEAAAAAAEAAAEARFQRATAVMPETRLGDGELIGVASLGIQGKVGRAKANEFKALLLSGIPVAYRAKIWAESSGAWALRVPGYYDDLVAQPAELDDALIVQQITADITRTLTDNIFFRKGPGVARLHEVLLAYARRNPEVGYCQGMNLITANLLLIAPTAEDAFWILVALVEHILPHGYYDHSLLASRADQQVLRRYVAEILPRLSRHFDELAIDLETMTFQWFLSVFTDCLSAEALFRVWDVVLCTPTDGGTFLFQVALALLKLNESQLLACESPASVYTYINHQMTNHAISIDGLVQASDGLKRMVKKEEVEARRERAVEAERELGRAREERLKVRRDEMEGKKKAVAAGEGAV